MTRSQQYGEGLERMAERREADETPNVTLRRFDVSHGITRQDFQAAEDMKKAINDLLAQQGKLPNAQ